jgi:hypothetical protein
MNFSVHTPAWKIENSPQETIKSIAGNLLKANARYVAPNAIPKSYITTFGFGAPTV